VRSVVLRRHAVAVQSGERETSSRCVIGAGDIAIFSRPSHVRCRSDRGAWTASEPRLAERRRCIPTGVSRTRLSVSLAGQIGDWTDLDAEPSS